MNEAALDTIKLGFTPYASPPEMQCGIDKIAPRMTGEQLSDFSQKTFRIFRREATPKLRLSIKTLSEIVKAGSFASAGP